MRSPQLFAGSAFLRAASFGQRFRFRESLGDPLAAQSRVLQHLIAASSGTAYGKSLRLSLTDDYSAFASKVPIVRYDDLEPWLSRQRATENLEIVPDDVTFYEPTSGSTAPSKLIPYTGALKEAFTTMFALWAADILNYGPKLERGTMFISTSPRRREKTERGVPIGSTSERDHITSIVSKIVGTFLVAPHPIEDAEEHRRRSARLLCDLNPEVISVWNPTALLEMLDSDARSSRLTPKLISCWGGLEARDPAAELAGRFPDALLQPKGLLATEAPVTFPSLAAGGFLPLTTAVFLEFADEEGIYRLHELQCGREYDVIVSQPAGLLRYRLGDRIRVTHRFRATPCLELVGRSDAVSDLVGEKLSAGFVANALAAVDGEGATLRILVPKRAGAKVAPRYVLLVDRCAAPAMMAMALERLFAANPRYEEARALRQLAPVETMVVDDLAEAYFEHCSANGIRRGDVKPRALIHDVSDATRFMNLIERRYAPALQ